jgi:hypothetical protein
VSGDVTISWIRRARIDGGLRDYVDIPLMEQYEQYDVKIYSGSTLLRSWRVNSPSLVYAAADQVTDFGAPPASLTVAVSQISALVGLGNTQESTILVQY